MCKVTLVAALVLVSAYAVLADGTTTAPNATTKAAGGKIVLNNFAEAKSPGIFGFFKDIISQIVKVFNSITLGIAGLFKPKGQVFHSAVEIVDAKKPEVTGTTAKDGATTAKAGATTAKAGETSGKTTAGAATTHSANSTTLNLGFLGKLLEPVTAKSTFKKDPVDYFKHLFRLN